MTGQVMSTRGGLQGECKVHMGPGEGREEGLQGRAGPSWGGWPECGRCEQWAAAADWGWASQDDSNHGAGSSRAPHGAWWPLLALQQGKQVSIPDPQPASWGGAAVTNCTRVGGTKAQMCAPQFSRAEDGGIAGPGRGGPVPASPAPGGPKCSLARGLITQWWRAASMFSPVGRVRVTAHLSCPSCSGTPVLFLPAWGMGVGLFPSSGHLCPWSPTSWTMRMY